MLVPTTDEGNSHNEKLILHLKDYPNPKNELNLVLNPSSSEASNQKKWIAKNSFMKRMYYE